MPNAYLLVQEREEYAARTAANAEEKKKRKRSTIKHAREGTKRVKVASKSTSVFIFGLVLIETVCQTCIGRDCISNTNTQS